MRTTRKLGERLALDGFIILGLAGALMMIADAADFLRALDRTTDPKPAADDPWVARPCATTTTDDRTEH